MSGLRARVEELILDLNADADYRVPKRYLGDRLRTALAEIDDARLARRLDWATGRNGDTLLAAIRSEGLDVIEVVPEEMGR